MSILHLTDQMINVDMLTFKLTEKQSCVFISLANVYKSRLATL